MSFAGHVYDMIRRNKENREMLDVRRERYKDMRKKMTDSSSRPDLPDMTPEEWERINRSLKKREDNEDRYAFQMKILFLGIGILTVVLIWVLVRLITV